MEVSCRYFYATRDVDIGVFKILDLKKKNPKKLSKNPFYLNNYSYMG